MAAHRGRAGVRRADPGHVIEVVKGGLIIDLGVRGFLPASLVDIRRVPNLDEFLGQTLDCKVIELNRSRNNVVLSRRAVLEEERKEQRQEILDRLQPGLVVEGVISNIVDFGAFVDLNGIDGLIHISELSWSHVNHPSEVIAIGDEVQVKVLDIDRDRQRISLGLKQTQEDPWQRVVSMYNVGDELEGEVTKVVTFGAFVEILDGVEGLVHISELAPYHVENPREIVNPGDEIKVKILEIDSERRRLSLSAKRVEDQILQPREGCAGPVAENGIPIPRDAGDLDDVPVARPERGRLRRGSSAEDEDAPDADAAAADGRRDGQRAGRGDAHGRPTTRPEEAGEVADARSREVEATPRPRSRRSPGGRRADEPAAPPRTSRPRTDETDGPPSERTRGRAVAGALRRPDRRAGRGEVDRARRARAPRRGDALDRRRRPRALRVATRCATRSSSAGATRSRRAARSTAPPSRGARSPPTTSARGSRA